MLSADQPPTLHPTLQYTSGWIGNSLNVVQEGEKDGKPDTTYKWVQKDGNGLAVTPDGTCYATAGWDEAGKGLGIYKDGDAIGKCLNISVGGVGVAADDKFVYASTSKKMPKGSPTTFTILRWNLDGSAAPLTDPASSPNFETMSPGIASLNGELYAADSTANTIRVFDRETLAEKRSFSCPQPFRLTIGSSGKLWVIHRAVSEEPNLPATLTEYDAATGQPTGRTIGDVDGATAVATTPAGLLLVAGPHEQVLKYDVSAAMPKLVGTVGVKDGIYADPPGEMGPGRLLGLWGVGGDARGNIYTVARLIDVGTGIDLRSFSPDGTQQWQLSSVGFTDVVGVDPASDGLDVYSRSSHFVLDPTKAPGQQFTWKGYTVDPAYDDGRITNHATRSGFGWSAPMMRRLDGRLYMYLHPGPYFGIFRQGPGELFVPSGLITLTQEWLMRATTGGHEHDIDWPPQQPLAPIPPEPTRGNAPPTVATTTTPLGKTAWLWRDTNGDGKFEPDEFQALPDRVRAIDDIADSWVDLKGDIWLSGNHNFIWHLPLQGFDAQKNPIYGWNNAIKTQGPAEFGNVDRVIYESDTDTMYLSGTSADFKGRMHWGAIGNVIICYLHWSDPAKRTIKWKLDVPQDPSKPDLFFPSFCVAGDRVFLMQRFWSRIWVFNKNDASYVGMITTTPETGTSGWCDMDHGVSAFQRKDGSYFVFAEDDYRPKIRFYIVPPQPVASPAPVLPSVSEP